MTRKRFTKLMRAAMIECYHINKANGYAPLSGGKVNANVRDYKLAEGKTYAEVWDAVNNALKGIVSVCR